MTNAIPNDRARTAQSWIFLCLTFFLLFSSFHWNVFRIEQEQRDVNIGVDGFITPTMELYAKGPALLRNFGEIELPTADIQMPEVNGYTRYPMQVGLQRLFYSWISPHSPEGVDRAVPYLRILIEALSALTFTAFVFVVWAEFNYVSAATAAVLLALSNWLIVFSPDLFYISVTFFIPFVLVWLLGDPSRSKRQRWLLAFLYTLFCLLKSLCGYDYITNIFAAAAVPLLYYGLRRGNPLPKIFMRIVRYGVLSIFAFCLTVSIQLMQFAFVQKDFHESLHSFTTEAGRRTLSGGEGISNRYDNSVLSILHRLHVSPAHDAAVRPHLVLLRPFLRYIRYLWMGAATVPLPAHSLKLPIGLFIAVFLVVFWFQRKRLCSALSSGPLDPVTAWMWASLSALLVSHIWVVVANGHMTHTFFNAIVFYIPFLPMVYAGAGIALASAVGRDAKPSS